MECHSKYTAIETHPGGNPVSVENIVFLYLSACFKIIHIELQKRKAISVIRGPGVAYTHKFAPEGHFQPATICTAVECR